MFLRHGLGTIDTVTHLDGVQIHLHDTLLGPHQFDQCREIHLKPFSHPRASWPQENVLCRLLRDCRGSQFPFLRMLTITLGSMFYRLIVKPVVIQELRILTGHHGDGQVFRDIRQGFPVVAQFQFLTRLYLFITTDQHQRRHHHWHKTQGYNRKNSGGKECHHYPFQCFLNDFHCACALASLIIF